MTKRITLFLSVLLFLLTTNLSAFTDFNFVFSSLVTDHEKGLIKVTARVMPGHMLYRDQLSFSASQGSLEINWADSERKNDPFENKEVDVYAAGMHEFILKVIPENQPVQNLDLKVNYQGCSTETCFMPSEKTFGISFNQPVIAQEKVTDKQPAIATQATAEKTAKPASPAGVQVDSGSGMVNFSEALQERGIYWVLLLALLGGLLVSLTPCVYPMIPITLSIIGSRDENQSFYKGLGLSVTYVAGLSLTYALLGLAAAAFGAQIRNLIQGTAFQTLVAVVFLLLGFSMFDFFMIQAPASLRNKLSGVKKTGLAGIFVMGMISGLMASPCVAAPLAGILAFIASTGNQFMGFFMLLVFAWGMSVPLLLIGAFSGSLNAMPKAGGWMERVKEFYGFLLFGAALYFIRPLVGPSWAEFMMAALLASFAAFLGAFNLIKEDSPLNQKVFKSIGIVFIAVACAFAISGTTRWGCLNTSALSFGTGTTQGADLFWYDDMSQALTSAKETGKPLFVDFRADWCSICVHLEKNVFPRPEIAVLLDRMTPVKIDATDHRNEKVAELMKQFSIVGLPTLVFIDVDGNEMTQLRAVGDIQPSQLERKLRRAISP